MTDSKEYVIDWEEFHRDARNLARMLNKGDWKGIIAVPRGGLVPAAIVARELNIKLVDTICISSYDHKEQGEANILKSLDLENGGDKWLVIDDLVDSGKTYDIVRKILPNAHLAVVYAKPDGIKSTDTFAKEFSQDTWVHFPWDAELKFSKPMVE